MLLKLLRSITLLIAVRRIALLLGRSSWPIELGIARVALRLGHLGRNLLGTLLGHLRTRSLTLDRSRTSLGLLGNALGRSRLLPELPACHGLALALLGLLAILTQQVCQGIE